MKTTNYLRMIAFLLSALVISLPVCFADELSLSYDANGNLIDDGTFVREYNSFNQLTRVKNKTSGITLQEFTHHPTEERVLVKKTYHENGTLKDKTIYIDENFVRVINGSGSFDHTYVEHEGQLVAELKPDGSKIYIHPDHLGSSTVVTNGSGSVIENTTYSPHGEVLSGGSETRYGYEGKEHDSVVGDTDFNFRKYKPEWGLFTQPDTLIQNVYDPQALNRYMFERGNPHKYVDEDGHSLESLSGPLKALASVGEGIVLYIKYTSLMTKAEAQGSQDLKNHYKSQRSKALSGNLNKALSQLVTGTKGQGTIEPFPGAAKYGLAVEFGKYYEDPPTFEEYEKDKEKLKIKDDDEDLNLQQQEAKQKEVNNDAKETSKGSSKDGSTKKISKTKRPPRRYKIVEIGGKYYRCYNCR